MVGFWASFRELPAGGAAGGGEGGGQEGTAGQAGGDARQPVPGQSTVGG